MEKNNNVKYAVLSAEWKTMKNFYSVIKAINANKENMPSLYKIVQRNGGKKYLCDFENHMNERFMNEMNIGKQRVNPDGTPKVKKDGTPSIIGFSYSLVIRFLCNHQYDMMTPEERANAEELKPEVTEAA